MNSSNEQLIEKAQSVTRPRKLKSGFTIGEVGCALITDQGSVFLGTCIDTPSGMGFCAEHSAISAMVTHGEQRIKKIVAVSNGGEILAPCGRCREFIHQIHEKNMETEVILGRNKVVTVKSLLPYPWDE